MSSRKLLSFFTRKKKNKKRKNSFVQNKLSNEGRLSLNSTPALPEVASLSTQPNKWVSSQLALNPCFKEMPLYEVFPPSVFSSTREEAPNLYEYMNPDEIADAWAKKLNTHHQSQESIAAASDGDTASLKTNDSLSSRSASSDFSNNDDFGGEAISLHESMDFIDLPGASVETSILDNRDHSTPFFLAEQSHDIMDGTSLSCA